MKLLALSTTPNATRSVPGVKTDVAKPICGPALTVSAIACSVRPPAAGKSAAVEVDASASRRWKSCLETPGGAWALPALGSEPPPHAARTSTAARHSAEIGRRRGLTGPTVAGGAGATRQLRRARGRSARPLQLDALEHVRDVLAGVDRRLEGLEDVLPADDDHRVDA